MWDAAKVLAAISNSLYYSFLCILCIFLIRVLKNGTICMQCWSTLESPVILDTTTVLCLILIVLGIV